MEDLGDLENGNLNDIIRNALSMALEHDDVQNDYNENTAEMNHDVHHTDDVVHDNGDDDEANMRLMEQLQAVISSATQDQQTETSSSRNSVEADETPSQIAEPEKPVRELSIAETLALSRNKMKLRPSNSDDVIDPMVTRYGLRRQQTHTVNRTTISNRMNGNNNENAKKTSSNSPSQDKESSIDVNMDTEEDNKDGTLNNDTLDAVQAVLQALGKSADSGTERSHDDASLEMGHTTSDMDPNGAPEKRRRRYRTSQELTPEEKERIRIENRLRKKKWRGINSDRNKDNDLRARLHRRAIQKFGSHNSPQKTKWIEEEFSKRKEKRIQRDKNISGKATTLEERETNASASEDSDLGTALETLAQSTQLDIKDAVNSLVKDPSVLKSMIDFLSDGGDRATETMESSQIEEETTTQSDNIEIINSEESIHRLRLGAKPPRPPPYISEEDKRGTSTITERSILTETEDEDLGIKSLGFPPAIGLRNSPHGRA